MRRKKHPQPRLAGIACGMVLFLASALGQAHPVTSPSSPTRIAGDVVPGKDWQTTAPESVGYSSAKLEALRAWVKTEDTDSMMVIHQGRVIFAYGDLAHTSKIASVRKSVLDMLYGADVMNGGIKDDVLNQSVKQLGLDDKQPFLPVEEHATLIQLMAARSGIYIASGDKDQQHYMPPRGSAYPGAQFVYNNWDFNAVGTAFEKIAHKDIFRAVQDDLAQPIGMQDFDPSKQKKNYSTESVHPEYAMYLSTRDMARLGLLMLNCGQWNGKAVLSCGWAQYSTYLHTPFRDITPAAWRNAGEPARWGYGFLWWVWDEQAFPGNSYTGFLQGAYSAMGTGGQFITVLPARGLVIVHKVDIDKHPGASVSPSSYIAMLSMIDNAQCGDSCK